MTEEAIIESGMSFGPYPEWHCFYIEKSVLYRRICEGVRIAELIVLRALPAERAAFWIVEAKSSTPRPETQPGFDAFIGEIRDKLTNALILLIATRLGRHTGGLEALSEPFKSADLSQADFRLVLVINGHQDAWCVPLQDALSDALRATVKTAGLNRAAVAVINDAEARRRGLIDVKWGRKPGHARNSVSFADAEQAPTLGCRGANRAAAADKTPFLRRVESG